MYPNPWVYIKPVNPNLYEVGERSLFNLHNCAIALKLYSLLNRTIENFGKGDPKAQRGTSQVADSRVQQINLK